MRHRDIGSCSTSSPGAEGRHPRDDAREVPPEGAHATDRTGTFLFESNRESNISRHSIVSQGEAIDGEFFERVTHEVSTAAMKYALLSVSCQARTRADGSPRVTFLSRARGERILSQSFLLSVVRCSTPPACALTLRAFAPPFSSGFVTLSQYRNAQTQISFDVKKVTSFEDASAPFILYNSARVTSLVRKFEARTQHANTTRVDEQ